MKQKLIGKNAIVTGASSGIGRATALALAKQGANVALIARNEARLNAVADEVRALGVQAEVLLADIRDEQQLKAAIDGAVERFGTIHICHCNAGIYLRCPAAELTQEQLRGMMENNFFGNLSTAYAILPHFRAQDGGHLIVTVSMDGKKGVPPDAAYVATKFALNGFFQVMRQELRREGIHVGMIFPSRTDTPQIAHVACPKITPKASPEKMANAVVKCIVRNKREMLVPYLPCKLLVLADAISPRLGDWMVRTFKLDGVQTGDPIV